MGLKLKVVLGLLEDNLRTVDREAKVEIVGVYLDNIPLIGDRTFTTNHLAVNCGSAITEVGNLNCYGCIVHLGKPSSPIGLTTRGDCMTIRVASSPTVVIGTNNSILFTLVCASLRVAQYDNKVIPVISRTALVGKCCGDNLATLYL